jgi:comEA protein
MPPRAPPTLAATTGKRCMRCAAWPLQSGTALHACSLEEESMNSNRPVLMFHHTFALLGCLLLGPALSAHAQAKPAQAKPPAAATPSASASAAPATGVSGVLNLNTASIEELTRLPGVGPSRAQAIVELRTKMNGFKSVEDIMRVRGIGRKTFRTLEPMLRLQGATTLTATRKASPVARTAAR